MAIKIIKRREEHLRTSCLTCGSKLKFSNNDIKYEATIGLPTNKTIYIGYINCPVCNEIINLKVMSEEEFKSR